MLEALINIKKKKRIKEWDFMKKGYIVKWEVCVCFLCFC